MFTKVVVCLLALAFAYAFEQELPTCQFEPTCYIGRYGETELNLFFGDLLKYNIFTFGDFTNDGNNPSDVQGRVAVGGNHQVPLGHSIGDQLCLALLNGDTKLPPDYNGANCSNLDEVCCVGYDPINFIVRGNSVWPGGRLYYGGGCVGDLENSQFGQFAEETGESECVFGTCLTLDGLTPGCQIWDGCVPNNTWWEQAHDSLHAISNLLYSLSPNGATFWEAGAVPGSPSGADYSASPFIWTNHLWLQPLGSDLHVFEIDADHLAQTTSFFWAPDPSCSALFDASNIGNCPFHYEPESDDYIVINVKADAGQDCFIANVNLDAFQPYASHVIWNFGECATLKLGTGEISCGQEDPRKRGFVEEEEGTGIAMHGMIIAPDTKLLANGYINGQVYVGEFCGPGQINWIPIACLDLPHCPEECVDIFGCVAGFNVFVLEDYYGESDVEGRLAAGGDISWAIGFTVGDKLFPNATDFGIDEWNAICERQFGTWDVCDFCDPCGQAVLVAGGNITSSPDSRIYFGNWLAPDLSNLDPSNPQNPEYATVHFYDAHLLDSNNCSEVANLSTKIQETFDQLKETSQHLCGLGATGTADPLDDSGILSIHLSGSPSLEVVYVDGTELASAFKIEISGWIAGATVIINVNGETSGFNQVDMTALQPLAQYLLWNFCSAKNLSIADVAVWGSILAPDADVAGGFGVINGQLVARSFNGPTQSNWVSFLGCISTCPPCLTHQCLVEDPCGECREYPSKTFWLGCANKLGLSSGSFFCDQCFFEENNGLGKFLGTVCNRDDPTYCLDLELEFSSYHGPNEIADGIWGGVNSDGYFSPYLEGFSERCWWACQTDDNCTDPANQEVCQCVQGGQYWDYFEDVIGTFVGHAGSPLAGFSGVVIRRNSSPQRGWGANLYNYNYGLSARLSLVFLSLPEETEAEVELEHAYAAELAIDIGTCQDVSCGTRLVNLEIRDQQDQCDPTEPCDDGTELTTQCTINYDCESEQTNPWPSCEEAYHFIGTVSICLGENVCLDSDWSTYFYVDDGVTVYQLWGDYVGDWEQIGNVVTVHSAGVEQETPRCHTIYFKACKPNTYGIFTDNDLTIDSAHCSFNVSFPQEQDIIIIEINNDRRRSVRAESGVECLTVNTYGCYNADLTNIQPPGSNCGTGLQETPDECPVCPDFEVSSLLSDSEVLNNYIKRLEEEIDVPSGTFTVISVGEDGGSRVILEVYINSAVKLHTVENRLKDHGYNYAVGSCSAAPTNASDATTIYISFVAIMLATILAMLL